MDAGYENPGTDVDLRAAYLAHLRELGLYHEHAPAALYENFLNIILANKRAVTKYETKPYQGGRAVVLKSEDEEPPDRQSWLDLIVDVSVHRFTATHVDFTAASNANQLAECLQLILQESNATNHGVMTLDKEIIHESA